MTAAVLSLGSNMGDSRQFLTDAVRALRPAVRSVSSIYRTPPWGPVAQDDFLNVAVVVADPDAGAADWLERAHTLERGAHRERRVRWGPRTLDVDVIAVWDGDEPVTSADPTLTLPHPRAHERAFVLIPWAEVQPDAVLVGHGPVADLVAAFEAGGIRRVGTLGL